MEVGEAFRGLADQALALEATEQTPAPAPAAAAETPAPTPTSPQVAPSAPQVPASDPQPVDLSPDTPVRIKVDGQEKIVKMSEYKEILQRTDVFTQRQQALAKAREELAQHYTQREAQIQQALQQIQLAQQSQGNPVDQLVKALQQAQAPQKAHDPNEIATLGEVQKAVREIAEQYQQARQQDNQVVQQLLEQKAQQVREELAVAQDQKRFTSAVQSALAGEDGQLLAEVSPEVEAQLRYRTLQMGPQDVDQAIEFLGQITKEWAGKVRGKLTVQQKHQEVAKALNVMEAPSGAPVPVAKSGPQVPVDKYGNVNLKALQAQAASLME